MRHIVSQKKREGSESTESLKGLISDEPAEEDSIGFESYTNALAAFLLSEETQPPLTVSVEGSWGMGKSSFMKQLRRKLDAEGAVTVEFNAWHHESAEDLWSGFVRTFISQIISEGDETLGWTRSTVRLYLSRIRADEGWRRVSWHVLVSVGLIFAFASLMFVTIKGLTLASHVFQLDGQLANILIGSGSVFVAIASLLSIASVLRSWIWTPLRAGVVESMTGPDYNSSQSFRAEAVDDFEQLTSAYLRDKTAYVFIDDLDRMEVPKAAELLRDINLYLGESDQVIFIFGMDRETVAAGLAASHESVLPFLNKAPTQAEDADFNEDRSGLDFGLRYLDKFVQVPVRVPKPGSDSVTSLLNRSFDTREWSGSIPSLDVLAESELQDLDSRAESWQKLMQTISELLDDNPRKIKTLGNLYRLHGFLAAQEGLLDGDNQQLASPQLAKYVALTIQYPQLVTKLRREPDIANEFEEYATGEIERTEVSSECEPWIHYGDVIDLFRHQGDKEIGNSTLSSEALQRLSRVAPNTDSVSESSVATDKMGASWFDSESDKSRGLNKQEWKIVQALNSERKIQDEFEISRGITAYSQNKHSKQTIENRDFHASERKSDAYYRLTTGREIEPYVLLWENGEWIKYGDQLVESRQERFFTEPRIIIRQAYSNHQGLIASYSDDNIVYNRAGIGLVAHDNRMRKAKSVTAILNSTLIQFYITSQRLEYSRDAFSQLTISNLREIPLPDEFVTDEIIDLVNEMVSLRHKRAEINPDIMEYLDPYPKGPTLGDLGRRVRMEATESVFTSTNETFAGLRMGEAVVEREGCDVTVLATARYRPENEEEHETDQWGYTKTARQPVLKFDGLAPREAELIELFVPVAVREGGGFANFYETATKTISPLDRLEALILPDPDAVWNEVTSYQNRVDQADQLDAKISNIEQRIDTKVYDIYEIPEDDRSVIESALGRWRGD